MILDREGLGRRVCEKLRIEDRETDFREWQSVNTRYQYPKREVNIAMVGKYTDFADSYKSLNEALIHAGIQTESRVRITYIDADLLIENEPKQLLQSVDAILVPGGFGPRGVE